MFDSQVQVAERPIVSSPDEISVEIRSSTVLETQSASAETEASPRHVPLPLRNDTFLGVCEAIGEDFGFNPNFLRVALASGILFNPTLVIGTYLALGVVVAASRYFFPRIRTNSAIVESAA